MGKWALMLQVPLVGYGAAFIPALLDEAFVEGTCRSEGELTSAAPEINVFLWDLLAFAYRVYPKNTGGHGLPPQN